MKTNHFVKGMGPNGCPCSECLRPALESISKSFCCEGCQEAKKVALFALNKENEMFSDINKMQLDNKCQAQHLQDIYQTHLTEWELKAQVGAHARVIRAYFLGLEANNRIGSVADDIWQTLAMLEALSRPLIDNKGQLSSPVKEK